MPLACLAAAPNPLCKTGGNTDIATVEENAAPAAIMRPAFDAAPGGGQADRQTMADLIRKPEQSPPDGPGQQHRREKAIKRNRLMFSARSSQTESTHYSANLFADWPVGSIARFQIRRRGQPAFSMAR